MGGLTILRDAAKKPELFLWNGPIPRDVLTVWLRDHSVQVSEELATFWQLTGGGDFFESETILGPFGDPSVADDVTGVNEHHWNLAMPRWYLIFHMGTGGLSAVDQRDGGIVQLDCNTYKETARFVSFNEWYCQALRTQYGPRYGLPLD
jgi:hypothetical protein